MIENFRADITTKALALEALIRAKSEGKIDLSCYESDAYLYVEEMGEVDSSPDGSMASEN